MGSLSLESQAKLVTAASNANISVITSELSECGKTSEAQFL
ncbi:hypothetical protein [Helicobacter macacae]|nr:hypothetical protein [Helicobacter macacae]